MKAITRRSVPTYWPEWTGRAIPRGLRAIEMELDDWMDRDSFRIEEFEEAGEMVVRAELPGLDPEQDIEIVVDDGLLTISAERREQRELQEEGASRSEFRYGSFVRRVGVPRHVDADQVSARYSDGVLEVRLPLREEAPEKVKVPIEHS